MAAVEAENPLLGQVTCGSLLERLQPEKTSGTIKEQLEAIAPALERLWKQKDDRIKEFYDLKSISDDTLTRLAATVLTLKEDKRTRLDKLQELASQLIDLWNLMDTPPEERALFDHVTCNISALANEVTSPGALALDLIEQAEVEVERLDHLKASRMKEIAFKRQTELEHIFARAHIEIDTEAARERILSLIDSGSVEPTDLLADMDNQIEKAKEEATSRKEILDKVEKWMSACEEESWLEDYNRDENRYNVSRGAHLNLKRAEKARVLVNKIPALVDSLVAKTRTWEEDHGITFTYDGVPLLAMLDEYAMLRHDREEEKKRLREEKKLSELSIKEQEVGPTPSPARQASVKKGVGPPRANGGANGSTNRRLSLNAHQNSSRSVNRDGKREARPTAPVNYVAVSKEDAASPVSAVEPLPITPYRDCIRCYKLALLGILYAFLKVRKSVKPRSLAAPMRIRKMHGGSYRVSLKELIAASPALNMADGDCNGKEMCYRVSMRGESGNGKLKKKVSFRSPQEADILVISPSYKHD
ncbi:hypothetical protein SASPL_154451 [Salvia splendens]|uniref:Protein regulator of cytokinesis 1 n=1 Tax=Salvia splendens TaxID=180675 RepID=A0A8X8W061_SALSN|nr:hypothetical protein SASPL_154451 [Salvia splendens]